MIRYALFPYTRMLLAALFLTLLSAFAYADDNMAALPATEGHAPYVWTIADVADIAIKNHPLMKQAEADVAAAIARKGQAQSAWYPALNLSTGYSRTRAWSVLGHRNLTTVNEFVRGGAEWMLYDFGRTGASVAAADALAGVSRENAVTTEHDVAFAAKVAFYNVLRAGNAQEFQQRNVGQRETLFKQAQAFYKTGVRAKIDFVRAEANLYDSRASLGQAMNDLRVARIILLQRIGLDLSSEFVLRGEFEETAIPGELPNWIEEGLLNRPEVRALLEKERSAKEVLRQAHAGHYPFLNSRAGYGYASDDFPVQQGYDVSVTLTQPLFSGFLVRERVREAQALLSSVRHEIVEAKRRVRLEVEQSAYSVQEARERLTARRKQQEAAAENLRLATARYEVGAGDIIEMTDAQTQMVSADIELNNSAFDLAVSQSSLLRAMGR
ncbi:MAG: TolC family protein [Syntrophorhabdaceae bacterium]|nr:TolC family protein [Syntrophorhabdaceae bacterium]